MKVKLPSWLQSIDTRKSACRSCGSAIYWGRTSNGKKIPVDAAGFPGEIVSHFATCPNAKAHRSRIGS